MPCHITATRLSAATLLLLSAALAHGQAADAAKTPATPAAPDDGLGAICTDRPTKSNYACVVETGHFQYEADILNGSRLDLNGSRTDTYLLTNPTLKYGLAKDVDIEVNWTPWVVVHSRDNTGAKTTLHGTGDTFLRVKWNFLNSADGKLSATLLPYVKAPTAKQGIGNRATEGGVLLPVNYKLTDEITLTTVPEFDALKDSDGSGRHLSTSQLINIGYTFSNNVTLYGELWGNWNFDPVSTVRQYSADVAVAWGLSKLLQIDAGMNFGLNKNTPGVQAYVGVSQKF